MDLKHCFGRPISAQSSGSGGRTGPGNGWARKPAATYHGPRATSILWSLTTYEPNLLIECFKKALCIADYQRWRVLPWFEDSKQAVRAEGTKGCAVWEPRSFRPPSPCHVIHTYIYTHTHAYICVSLYLSIFQYRCIYTYIYIYMVPPPVIYLFWGRLWKCLGFRAELGQSALLYCRFPSVWGVGLRL